MSNLFREFNLRGVVCYLDDILIYSNSPEEHESIVRNVLLKLISVGLQLNAEKCNFFCRSVVFLGYRVFGDGVATDEGKIEAVRKWPRPDTVKELRSFMGFVAYYSKFMKDFTTMTNPLQQLIVDVNTSSGKVLSKILSKKIKVVWNDKA